ncbi:MAG: DedA family protein [Fimbriimonadaceae bacterium]|nr:DedA family protein [Fimbriimonadaceae bacterium]
MNPLSQLDDILRNSLSGTGPLAYLLIALLAFSQTGLLIGPLIPGNTLLFIAGLVIRTSEAHPLINLIGAGAAAAFVGNVINFWLGAWLGPKIKWKEKGLVSAQNLKRTEAFFSQHGSLAIFIAPFVPIVRSFAPFVAGMAKMKPSLFIMASLFGPALWVVLFMASGYFLGTVPIVRDNITLFAGGIFVLVSAKIFWTLAKQKKRSAEAA